MTRNKGISVLFGFVHLYIRDTYYSKFIVVNVYSEYLTSIRFQVKVKFSITGFVGVIYVFSVGGEVNVQCKFFSVFRPYKEPISASLLVLPV